MPDGYTLTLATNATLVTYPLLSPSTAKYKADKDFTPISFFVRTSMLVITANSPTTPKSIGELTAVIRAKPVSFASNGAGTIGHLVTEAYLLNRSSSRRTSPTRGAASRTRTCCAARCCS